MPVRYPGHKFLVFRILEDAGAVIQQIGDRDHIAGRVIREIFAELVSQVQITSFLQVPPP